MSSANPPSEYFTSLARNYAHQTGNSTRDLFALSYPLIEPQITPSSIIHDNAGGVGTAASVIVENFASTSIPEMMITDNNPAMIAAARDTFKDHEKITAIEMDSQDLKSIPNGKFTHSILNFSVFLFPDAPGALREIHRTLRDDGVAVLITWKRFGFGSIIHAAQGIVRPDLLKIPLPGSHFLNEGVLAKMAVEAGFEEGNVRVSKGEIVQKGEDLQGMKDFMMTGFLTMATKGWSDEDREKWPAAVEEAIRREVEEFDGIKFEGWTVIARK
jgi:ubiquinone/menaquinone biosynthesis C-methylase UbiE